MKRLILALVMGLLPSVAMAAFPQVASVTPSQFSSAATSHSVAFPATVNAGDLLIILAASSNTGNQNPAASGFTSIGESNRVYVLVKIAAGTEGGSSVNLTVTNSSTAAAQVIRVTDWFGDLAGVELSTANSVGGSPAANPPSETASWGAEDNLWLACMGAAGDVTVTSGAPTDYTDLAEVTSGGGAAMVAHSQRELASATDDPTQYIINVGTINRSYTIVIRPGSAPAPSTGNFFLLFGNNIVSPLYLAALYLVAVGRVCLTKNRHQ